MGERTPRTLMVTGGCGFIGSGFVHFMLEESDVNIVSLDSLISGDSANIETSERCTTIMGDICNIALLEKTLNVHNVTEIVHFAALTHVTASFEDPQQYVRANIEGTLNLLDAVRKYGQVKRFVYISTDEVYGDGADGIEKIESSSLAPTNPYSASKLSAETFVDVYRVSYNIPACGVRMCNVYGPRQTTDKVIPKFIKLAVDGKPFTIEGDGLQLRNWIYVTDACRAIYSVLLKGRIGEIYNISTSSELSVLDMAKKLKFEVETILGKATSKFETTSIPDRPYNDQRYYMSSRKLREELGWSEQVSLSDGLKSTVSWYCTNRERKPGRENKILVYGANGWIGQQFCRLLNSEGIPFVAGKRRLGDDADQAIEDEILGACPTHVVSFIGRTHGPGNNTIDYLEGGPDKLVINLRDNLFGPMLLAEVCRKLGIHFTYIGSGCLFTYTDEHPVGSLPFTEDDVPNYFGSSYSVVKGYTDRLMHHYDNVLNIRMRLPVSDEANPRNLITKLANYPKIMSIPNSVTVLPELLPALLELMKKKHVGTVNLVNHGSIEHKDILATYTKYVDPLHKYELVDIEDPSEFATGLKKKRSNCYLATDVLAKLCPQVSGAEESVSRAIEEMARHSK